MKDRKWLIISDDTTDEEKNELDGNNDGKLISDTHITDDNIIHTYCNDEELKINISKVSSLSDKDDLENIRILKDLIFEFLSNKEQDCIRTEDKPFIWTTEMENQKHLSIINRFLGKTRTILNQLDDLLNDKILNAPENLGKIMKIKSFIELLYTEASQYINQECKKIINVKEK